MSNRQKVSAGVVLLCGVIIFSYIVTKASVASFTHDESYSYLHYVPDSFMDIISNQAAYSNNHVLNTLFMKYSEQLFGSSELALRLPNLVMLLVFFTYTFLLFRKANPVVCISVFILMATNTTLIDFFGLARGYGMSIGFMLMAIYHLVNSFESHKNRNLVLFNLASMLAILSNFTMLGFYISALFVFNLVKLLECRIVLKEKFSFFRANKVNIILFAVLFVVLYEPVRKAVKFNTFDFGGKNGFVTDTINSLIFHIFSYIHLSSPWIAVLQVSIMMICLGSIVLTLVNIYRGNTEFFIRSGAIIIVSLVLFCISIESIIQHYVLKSDFLVGRFSLFLFPLFVLNLGFLFEYFLRFRYRYVVHFLAITLAILSASNFYMNRDLYSCAEWAYDSGTKNAMTALVNDQKNMTGLKPGKIKLGINWLFEPTVNFYRETWKLTWLLPADRNGLSGNEDYVYIFSADTVSLQQKEYATIFSSVSTNTLLCAPRRR